MLWCAKGLSPHQIEVFQTDDGTHLQQLILDWTNRLKMTPCPFRGKSQIKKGKRVLEHFYVAINKMMKNVMIMILEV